MKALRIQAVILLCLACSASVAQQAVAVSHYVLEHFSKGTVFQKNKKVDEAVLNYNVLSKEMIFEQSPGHYMALANPEDVDSVVIGNRKFLPVNGEFYELISRSSYPLFVQYSCTVKEPGSDIGYGMSSVTTASPAIKSLISKGGAYELKLPDGFEVMPLYTYWMLKDGKYQKVKKNKLPTGTQGDKQ